MSKYFVWIKGFNGKPEPQIWHDNLTDGAGKDLPFLFKKELDPDHSCLSLNTLMELYPYETKK